MKTFVKKAFGLRRAIRNAVIQEESFYSPELLPSAEKDSF
jgi:hypothetical protein